MGATGSYCNCFDRWFILSEGNAVQDKVIALEKKYITMETNTNTLHTKYSTLELKLDQLHKKLAATTIDVELLTSKLEIVEKKASTMIHTQDELDCDIVVVQ